MSYPRQYTTRSEFESPRRPRTARLGDASSQLVRVSSKGALAIVDQALFAGSNFIVSALLARWLTVAEYGAFAIAYTGLQLLFALHASCTTEPMMVYGPSRFAASERRYLASSSWLALALAVGFSAALWIAAIFVFTASDKLLAIAFLSMAVAAPAILVQRFLRSAFYMRLEPLGAVAGGSLYLGFTLALLLLAHIYGALSLALGALIMGVASVASALFFLSRLRPSTHTVGPTVRDVSAVHWTYSRWSLPTAVLTFVPGNLCYFLLPVWGGLAGTAQLQASMNLVLPILHTNGALAMLVVPSLVRTRSQHGESAMIRRAWQAFILLAGMSVAYLGLLLILGQRFADWFYQGKYTDLGFTLLLAGLLPLTGAAVTILAGVARAYERPREVFWSYLAASGFASTVGIVLLWQFDLIGAFLGLLGASIITSLSLIARLRTQRLAATEPKTDLDS